MTTRRQAALGGVIAAPADETLVNMRFSLKAANAAGYCTQVAPNTRMVSRT